MPNVPALEFVTELRAKVATPVEIGEMPLGRRRIIEILGGTFDGPMMKGVIPPGGADWQYIRSDGVAYLDARYMLKTDDGALIYVSNTGLRHGPPEIMKKLIAGEAVPEDSYYFYTVPVFETSAPRYQWMHKHVFLAKAMRHPTEVVIQVWRVG